MAQRHKSKRAAKNSRRSDRKKLKSKKSKPRSHSARLPSHARQLVELCRWLLPEENIFASLPKHGNRNWLPRELVWLAVFWAWSETVNVTDAFAQAVEWCGKINMGPALRTYQGFMGAAVSWSEPLLRILWPVLHERMQQMGGEFWRIGGWVPIAFDGSRTTTPRSLDNERAFCAPNYGQGRTAKYRKKKTKGMRRRKNEKNKGQPQEPQVWITLLWHMGLRLPWTWRLGPSNSSEREHVQEMIREGNFPENTLLCGDAGFVGYPLWSNILSQGCHFLCRVGANVHLLREQLDCRFESLKPGIVLCWPQHAMAARQPPLRLRLLKVRIGKTEMWILTSVLQASELNNRQIKQFYKMRWGIEVEFRGLKQTLGQAKLRCLNDARAQTELHWSLMAMTIAELFALKEQLSRTARRSPPDDRPVHPDHRSLANTMRALRYTLHHLYEGTDDDHDLIQKLRQAVTDPYRRKAKKQARYRPPNPDKKPLGAPKVRPLKPKEKQNLNAL